MKNLTILMALTCVLAAGCGGGGGGSEPDLNGWWEFSIRDVGPDAPYGYLWLGPAAQSGTRVTYFGYDFGFDGNTLSVADPDFAAEDRQEYRLTARSPDLLEGQALRFDAGVRVNARDIRMRRVAVPTGSLTGVGNLGGGPLDWSCPTGYAAVEASPGAGFTLYDVDIVDAGPAAASGLQLSLSLPTYVVFPLERTIPVGCRLWLTLANGASYEATNGTVRITAFVVNERIQGTYQAIFGLDGAVEGAFDVPVRGRY